MNEESDKEKSGLEITQEVIMTDYQRMFTQPLTVSDETRVHTDYTQNKAKPMYEQLQSSETLKWRKDNPLSSLRNDPSLESKLTPSELDKYATQQAEDFKARNKKPHKFTKKNSKKLQARTNRNKDKFNAKAAKHAGIERASRKTDLQNKLAIDKKQAIYRHIDHAIEHGEGKRRELFKLEEERLKAKYTKGYKWGLFGSFAAFFASDVFSKLKQKKLNDTLEKQNNPESKAKASVRVVAINR